MINYQDRHEEWRKIPEFPNYSVSRSGEIRNDNYDRLLKPALTNNGGLYVGFFDKNGQHKRYLSPIVAEAFVVNQTGYEPDIDYDTPMHINGDKTDCSAVNLVWATRSQAVAHHRRFKDVQQ